MYNRDENPTVVWLNAAALVAPLSSCTRAKVGAVVVDGANMSGGYNDLNNGARCDQGACPRGKRTYLEQPPGGNYSDCDSIHAEVNAITQFQRRYRVTANTKLYTTREPCTGCWAAILLAGIQRHNVIWSK